MFLISNEKIQKYFPDQKLITCLLGILLLGFFALSSAAHGGFLAKQLVFLIVSLGLISVSYLFDLSFYRNHAWVIYWLNIGMLLLLKVFGSTVAGSQRWLILGPISIQPSEIAKICIIIALAAWLAKRPVETFKDIVITLLIISLPAGLVFLQPDLGTTLVYGAITLGMIFWSGASLVQILLLISPLVTAITSSLGNKIFTYSDAWLNFSVTVPVVVFLVIFFILIGVYYKVWQSPWLMSLTFLALGTNIFVLMLRPLLWGLLKDYQQKRLTIFLDPSVDPLGAGYHIIQSLYAIGSGGFWGRGLKSGDLTQGNFVPEQHTDFVFSVIGEELGLVGGILLVSLYAILALKLIRIASASHDNFSSLLVIGILSMFLFHIFVNIGMNLGLMPITGVPLPFVSYGGTSLLVDLFLMSLVLKVVSQERSHRALSR